MGTRTPWIVLATRNEHKITEIKAVLGSIANCRTLRDYLDITVKEAGRTLLANSLAKAVFAFKATGQPALADDSGLFVDALDGEPGVYSSRYAKNDTERINKVLKNMRTKKNRAASFRAVFVYYFAPQKYEVFRGRCTGEIALEPRGAHGFGYDPIFIPQGYKKTFSELGPDIKNKISHRAKALQQFKEYLKGSA
jgi:XTP/dITP diphosphohydrolase